jgi:hypothetical protein
VKVGFFCKGVNRSHGFKMDLVCAAGQMMTYTVIIQSKQKILLCEALGCFNFLAFPCNPKFHCHLRFVFAPGFTTLWCLLSPAYMGGFSVYPLLTVSILFAFEFQVYCTILFCISFPHILGFFKEEALPNSTATILSLCPILKIR